MYSVLNSTNNYVTCIASKYHSNYHLKFHWIFYQRNFMFFSWKFLSGFCLFCGDCHFRGGVGELEVIPWGLMHQPLYFGILHQLHITSHLVLSALILTHPFPTRPSPSIHSASSPLQGKSKWKSKPNAFYQMTTTVIFHNPVPCL